MALIFAVIFLDFVQGNSARTHNIIPASQRIRQKLKVV